MKKEKSKVWNNILSVIVTSFLVLNILFQFSANDCWNDLGNIQSDIDDSMHLIEDIQFEYMKQWVEASAKMATYVKIGLEEDGGIKQYNDSLVHLWMNPTPQGIAMTNLYENMSKVESHLLQMKRDRIDLTNECRQLEKKAQHPIYLALILTLITILHGVEIFKLYKT